MLIGLAAGGVAQARRRRGKEIPDRGGSPVRPSIILFLIFSFFSFFFLFFFFFFPFFFFFFFCFFSSPWFSANLWVAWISGAFANYRPSGSPRFRAPEMWRPSLQKWWNGCLRPALNALDGYAPRKSPPVSASPVFKKSRIKPSSHTRPKTPWRRWSFPLSNAPSNFRPRILLRPCNRERKFHFVARSFFFSGGGMIRTSVLGWGSVLSPRPSTLPLRNLSTLLGKSSASVPIFFFFRPTEPGFCFQGQIYRPLDLSRRIVNPTSRRTTFAGERQSRRSRFQPPRRESEGPFSRSFVNSGSQADFIPIYKPDRPGIPHPKDSATIERYEEQFKRKASAGWAGKSQRRKEPFFPPLVVAFPPPLRNCANYSFSNSF